jgi:hypothetical protein
MQSSLCIFLLANERYARGVRRRLDLRPDTTFDRQRLYPGAHHDTHTCSSF